MHRALRLVGEAVEDYAAAAFLERYRRLCGRARQLTRDRDLAHDLVQDTFVQFTLARTALADIRNVDAYLFTMLHNIHTSEVRRAARTRQSPLELIDHDTAYLAMRASDVATRLQAYDQLRLLCEYGCNRCGHSKAGSVLLLRYFHGYYAREIAAILRMSRSTVDGLLHVARNEARAYAATPPALAGTGWRRDRGESASPTRRGCLDELRAKIFDSAHAECFPPAWFEAAYDGDRAEALSCAQAAEIVTCRHCLDAVNRVLGLPPLADRYPTDSLDQDRRSPPGGGGTGAAGGEMGHLRRAASDVFEHRPEQLLTAVNGFVVGSLTVAATRTEQNMSLTVGEPIAFIEIFSDQQVRLLFLAVQPAAEGVIEQHARVELSDLRLLEARLDLSDTWPALHVAYLDPSYHPALPTAPVQAVTPREIAQSGPHGESSGPASCAKPTPAPEPALDRNPSSASGRWSRLFDQLSLPRRLVPATALILLLGLCGFHFLFVSSDLSARELLDHAAAAEKTSAAKTGVEHRMLLLEERRVEDGTVVARTRVEVWRHQQAEEIARRAFDERTGKLAGMEIVKGDLPTIYRPGIAPQSLDAAAATAAGAVEAGDLWRLEPSVSRALELAEGLSPPVLADAGQNWTLYWERPPSAPGRIIKIILTLTKDALRPIAEVLVIRQPGGPREYRFQERAVERLREGPVTQPFFEPDRGLAPGPSTGGSARGTASPIPQAMSGLELASLQVDAFYLLNQAGATSGEQISVTRTSSSVYVAAVVDSEARKREILGSLAPLASIPAIGIDVRTAREAAASRPARRAAAVRDVASREDQIAIAADLRRYFVGHADPLWPATGPERDEHIDHEVVQFGARALDRARRALEHAWALEHLLGEIPSHTAALLSPACRERWRSMVRDHARAVRDATRELRTQLDPVLWAGQTGGEAVDAEVERTDLTSAAARLLSRAIVHDDGVRAAFTYAAGETARPQVVTAVWFRESLLGAERLAEKLADVR